MSQLIERIEEKIRERGTNFKRVEVACGLGNGTIKRWNEQSPRLDKLVLVSEYLQVSLDYLVFGRSVSETSSDSKTSERNQLEEEKAAQGLLCDGSPLDEDEADIIAMYRLLSKVQRHELYDFVYFKYQREVERGRGYTSSGSTGAGQKGRSGPGEEPDSCTETA